MNKTSLILFLFLAVFYTTNGLEIPDKFINYSSIAIAKAISDAFINRLQNGVGIPQNTSRQKSPRVTTAIPPSKIKDPLVLENVEIPLNLNLSDIIPGVFIEGHFSACTPHITGYSKIKEDYKFTGNATSELTVRWNISYPNITWRSHHKMSLNLGFLNKTLLIANSEGEFVVTVYEPFFNVLAKGRSKETGTLVLESLDLDFGFDRMTISAENSDILGSPIPWNLIGSLMKIGFGFVWNPQTKPVVQNATMCIIELLIQRCTYWNLIQGYWPCIITLPDPEIPECMRIPDYPTNFSAYNILSMLSSKEDEADPYCKVPPTGDGDVIAGAINLLPQIGPSIALGVFGTVYIYCDIFT